MPAGQLHRDAAELRGERDVRPERLELLGADHGDVHGVRDEPAVERGDDLLGDDHARAILRLVGRRGEVRRDDDVVELEQRARVRLFGEDVERRAGDLAALQRVDESGLVDQLAARRVDDPYAVAHLRERRRVRATARLRRERQMQREELGSGVDALRRLDPLDAELAKAVGGDERVVGDARACRDRAARRATCWPIRPKPSTPSVLPASSMPP